MGFSWNSQLSYSSTGGIHHPYWWEQNAQGEYERLKCATLYIIGTTQVRLIHWWPVTHEQEWSVILLCMRLHRTWPALPRLSGYQAVNCGLPKHCNHTVFDLILPELTTNHGVFVAYTTAYQSIFQLDTAENNHIAWRYYSTQHSDLITVIKHEPVCRRQSTHNFSFLSVPQTLMWTLVYSRMHYNRSPHWWLPLL